MKRILLPFFLLGSFFYVFAQKPQLIPPMGHAFVVKTLAVSPDGKYVLTCADNFDNTALLWSDEGKLLKILEGHQSGIADAEFSSDGKYMLTLEGKGGSLYIWDNYGQKKYTFPKSNFFDATFTPDNQSIFVSSSNKLSLYDLKGKLIKEFQTGNSPAIKSSFLSVAVSRDGSYFAASDRKGLILIFDKNGAVLKTLDGHKRNPVSTVKFSPDGQQLLSGGEDKMGILWNWSDARVIKAIGPLNTVVRTVAFSPDGKMLAIGGPEDKAILLWKNEENTIKNITSVDDGVNQLVFTPDGKSLLVAPQAKSAKKYDLSTGKLIAKFTNNASPVTSVSFSKFKSDSTYLLTGGEFQHIRLWDITYKEAKGFPTLNRKNIDYNTPVIFNSRNPSLLFAATGESMYEFNLKNGLPNEINKPEEISYVTMAASNDGNSMLTSDYTGGFQLWTKDEKIWKFKDGNIPFDSDFITSLAFSPDDNYFLTAVGSFKMPSFGKIEVNRDDYTYSYGEQQYPVSLRRKSDFSEVRTFGKSADQAVFSPDGKWVATNDSAGLCVFNSQDAQLLFRLKNSLGAVTCLAFASDSKTVIAGFSNNSLNQYDLKGNFIREFKGHYSTVLSVAFSPNGQFLLSGSNDNTAKLWDVAKGIELATLIAIGANDWVITTPTGLFDASEGAMNQLYYVSGLEIIAIDQLKERYYEPGLLRKIMFNIPLRKVADLDNAELAIYPQLLKAELVSDVIKIQLKKRSGGIGKVSILIDGRQEFISQDLNPDRKENFEIELLPYSTHFKPGKPNSLSLVFYAADNWLKSAPETIVYTPSLGKDKGNGDKPKPSSNEVSLNADVDASLKNTTLYALIVGTSNYQGDKIDLKFPDLDAAAFKDFLEKSGKELFAENLKIQLLTTAKKGTPPTFNAIRRFFIDFASKATPDDILLVYFSGHGATWPENDPTGQFYLLTTENSSFDFTDAANKQKAIVQDSLQLWMKNLYVRKRVLILDACNSGKFINKMDANAKGANNLNDDQRRALQKMRDRSGFFVLAGSSADKLSYEDPRFGHGLLTYSLLRNMPMVAATDKNNYVDIYKLFQVVNDDVPKLASLLNKVQEPKIIGREDFSIGIIKDASKFKLPNDKKIIINSNFVNEKARDVIKLSDAINGQLENVFQANPDSPFNFYAIDQFNGAHFEISGNYKVTDSDVTVTAYFYNSLQDTELKSFTATGKSTDVKKLAEGLVNQIITFLNTLK